MLQVTLSIELTNSQVDDFERMIPVQLAQPPWNYTRALSKGIKVYLYHSLTEGWLYIVTMMIEYLQQQARIENIECLEEVELV